MELHPPAQRSGRSALIWSLIALAIGLALSVAIAGNQYRALAAVRDDLFDRLAERGFTALRTTLNTCGLLARSVQTTLGAGDGAGRLRFAAPGRSHAVVMRDQPPVATSDDPSFVPFVLEAITRHNVPPEKLCFEITETAVIAGIDRVLGFMQELHRVGCRFALDDVGAGMASFGYLKNLPVDILKIDGSFVRDMQSDPVSHSMVRALTQIGHQLGLEVIAEWASNERELALLREVGVDYVQGYAVHRPETALPWRDGA